MKLYFVTDIHGSDICFKKFVNASKYYGADVLVLGGDITGKMMVPLVRSSDGTYSSQFNGSDVKISTAQSKDEFIKNVKFNGFYPVEMSEEEYLKALNDKRYRDSVFENVMLDSVKSWVKLAEDRLQASKIQVYISSGNDDLLSMDDVLREAETEHVHFVEKQIAFIEDKYELLSWGDANKTPWNTPREFTEEELHEGLKNISGRLQSPSTSIFNVHVPPIGIGLDVCADLDETLKPIIHGGEIQMKSAGSTSVKTVMEEVQPMLGLHGHIHESPAIAKLGRTVCINPGSEYSQGVLRGALVTIEKEKLKHYTLTKG